MVIYIIHFSIQLKMDAKLSNLFNLFITLQNILNDNNIKRRFKYFKNNETMVL